MKTIALLVALVFGAGLVRGEPKTGLDPRGKVHIPIGVADTVDTLKTFVEPEGNFSPGVGSYGIYFWIRDQNTSRLVAPTLPGMVVKHGLEDGYLIPWSSWSAGLVRVRTELCQVARPSPQGPVQVVGARVHLRNEGTNRVNLTVYTALRSLGPAGWPVERVSLARSGRILSVNDHPAIICGTSPDRAGLFETDTVGELLLRGDLPPAAASFGTAAAAAVDEASAALGFRVSLAPAGRETLTFVCPVLAGRRAAGHQWDGVSTWAQLDLARPNPAKGGLLQPDPGPEYWRRLRADDLFTEAREYWREIAGAVRLRVPDPRWAESIRAIMGHSALCLNEGAPDVAVVNYNVFNRDGVYLANIFQKFGRTDLAERAIDYFLTHPFNGRVQPEADNPGQILWALGEQWRFTGNHAWLRRIYSAADKLGSMVEYYRSTPGPHWVWPTSLEHGSALAPDKRVELKPGACDGHHPEYTEAFDLAGIRAMARLAEAMGRPASIQKWKPLAERLGADYNHAYGTNLARAYGSYCVLWPCRLYDLASGPAFEQFKSVGPQAPASWHYFPLATAHQGLLAGQRDAAAKTIQIHLDHPQMRGWYAFDEGGDSGPGGWNHLRTTWRQGKASDAMPHGWAIAEFILLLRDALLFEWNDQVVLFAGVPAEWFRDPIGIELDNFPTYFGQCDIQYHTTKTGATLRLRGNADPAGGFLLRLPEELGATVLIQDEAAHSPRPGDWQIPEGVHEATLTFPPAPKK